MKNKIIFSLIVIAVRITAHGQDAPPFDAAPYFSAVIVNNIDSPVIWYQSVFGLKVKERMNERGTGFKVVILESSGFLLELIENKSSLMVKNILANKPGGTKIQGLFKTGFKVSNMDACIKHLSDLKVTVGFVYKDSSSGKRNFLINDPDGNLIQFFE